MKIIKRTFICCLVSLWILAGISCTGRDSENPDSQPICWAEAELEGGSGRAQLVTPCPVYDRDGELFASICWSSSHYDFMVIEGETILPENEEGSSEFLISLGSREELTWEGEQLPQDMSLEVQADTTAMSTPHLIDYTIHFRFHLTKEEAERKEEKEAKTEEVEEADGVLTGSGDFDLSLQDPLDIEGLTFLSRDENVYAGCFVIDRYEDGYALLSVDDRRRYLIVPEDGPVPEKVSDGPEKLIILKKPLDRIYLAASAAMCQFDEIGAVENVILSGLEKDDWTIDSVREAMEAGTLFYGGKYSKPDYEKIVESGTDLAVESTMILHTPKVQEKLEGIGVPVLIDRSSYEREPLGRAEWVRVYGLLTGREEEADMAFAEQRAYLERIAPASEDSVKTLAVFSFNAGRQIMTRTGEGYFARMAEIAGGQLMTPVKDSIKATETVSMESFYAAAADADFLFYNTSIEDAPQDLAALCEKDEIMPLFKAVSEGNVWCMKSSLYQNANRTGQILRDLHAILQGEAGEETEFFYLLK